MPCSSTEPHVCSSLNLLRHNQCNATSTSRLVLVSNLLTLTRT